MAPVDYTICGLAVVIFASWCINWLLHIFAIVYGKWRLSHKLPPYVAEELPAVSILKPLVGVDPHLYENLETFFKMKYPQYELLFCIQDEMDAALMIVQSLIQKYPKVDAKLFIGGRKIGINPKINNMILGYEAAKHDLILISDSGLKMGEDTLLDMVLLMTEKTGLVHQMPYICDRKGFSSHIEKVYFGTQHAKMYLCANGLGINCTTGMSCLFRKEVLEEAGGMNHLGQYLAEDYMMAQAFIDRGWKVRISSQAAQQNSGMYSIPHFHARLIRWTKLRISTVPSTIVMEPIFQCMFLGGMASWAVSYLFDWTALVFFLIHILVWFLGDYILIKVVQRGPLPFSKFEFVVGWLMNELVSPYLIFQAHWNPAVTWRSQKYRIRWGGITEEIKPPPPKPED
ncbi:ceramide glucosyltransferase-like [Haliotis cracherodii]|uniref:ceramide glucosyltransferase-like n=1 Tax=Haliotis rufescens TaxID=6454 RepID=UPI001EB05785|nr:ceramide glucosyltransferase-like [Haliotis rufescens]